MGTSVASPVHMSQNIHVNHFHFHLSTSMLSFWDITLNTRLKQIKLVLIYSLNTDTTYIIYWIYLAQTFFLEDFYLWRNLFCSHPNSEFIFLPVGGESYQQIPGTSLRTNAIPSSPSFLNSVVLTTGCLWIAFQSLL